MTKKKIVYDGALGEFVVVQYELFLFLDDLTDRNPLFELVPFENEPVHPSVDDGIWLEEFNDNDPTPDSISFPTTEDIGGPEYDQDGEIIIE